MPLSWTKPFFRRTITRASQTQERFSPATSQCNRQKGGVDELCGIPVELERNLVEPLRALVQLEPDLAHL